MKTEEEIIRDILAEEIAEIESEEENLPAVIDIKEVSSNPENRAKDINDDYAEVRKLLHTQLQLMDKAARQGLVNMLSCDHPKMMEAFAKLMDSMGNAAEKLLKAQKDMKELQGGSAPKGGTINAENVFIGTSADLLNEEGGAQEIGEIIEGQSRRED